MAKDKEMKPVRIEERIDADTDRLYGPLDQAIAYLCEIKARHPEAMLDEHWEGYEDMTMTFVWDRAETSEETEYRLAREKELAARETQRAQDEAARNERRKQWEKLSREFGR